MAVFVTRMVKPVSATAKTATINIVTYRRNGGTIFYVENGNLIQIDVSAGESKQLIIPANQIIGVKTISWFSVVGDGGQLLTSESAADGAVFVNGDVTIDFKD